MYDKKKLDEAKNEQNIPDKELSAKEAFGINSKLKIPAFSKKSEYVPNIDTTYHFDYETTLAILVGFKYNRKVLIQGFHGTGKSTHIEQVAARLNWPCIRINLDSHISRIDLIGKDAIILKENNYALQVAPNDLDMVKKLTSKIKSLQLIFAFTSIFPLKTLVSSTVSVSLTVKSSFIFTFPST